MGFDSLNLFDCKEEEGALQQVLVQPYCLIWYPIRKEVEKDCVSLAVLERSAYIIIT